MKLKEKNILLNKKLENFEEKKSIKIIIQLIIFLGQFLLFRTIKNFLSIRKVIIKEYS